MKRSRNILSARMRLCNFHVLLLVATLLLIGTAHAQTFNVLYAFQTPDRWNLLRE